MFRRVHRAQREFPEQQMPRAGKVVPIAGRDRNQGIFAHRRVMKERVKKAERRFVAVNIAVQHGIQGGAAKKIPPEFAQPLQAVRFVLAQAIQQDAARKRQRQHGQFIPEHRMQRRITQAGNGAGEFYRIQRDAKRAEHERGRHHAPDRQRAEAQMKQTQHQRFRAERQQGDDGEREAERNADFDVERKRHAAEDGGNRADGQDAIHDVLKGQPQYGGKRNAAHHADGHAVHDADQRAQGRTADDAPHHAECHAERHAQNDA